MFSLMKNHPIAKIVNNTLLDLPSPSNISAWWNFGSLLGLCLSVQLISGVLLAMRYTGDIDLSFMVVSHLTQDIPLMWFARTLHANSASFFFFCLYFHVGRGMYYSSYRLHMTWNVGVIILLMVMASAFLGYVLPWGQMSFWGATVITSLFAVIPFVGEDIVVWLWGGFGVGNATLVRFFAFHFLVPFIVAAMVMIHLLFLHQTGSNNPLGVKSDYDKIPFQPFFASKDLMGVYFLFLMLAYLVLMNPWLLGDPENFIMSNPLMTPVHIQPEWYFLFAYAILRSIPNKLGGVIALAMAILILLAMTLYPQTMFQNNSLYPLNSAYFWSLIGSVMLLTWIGARPVEEPYVLTGQILTVFYFSFYAILPMVTKLWDTLLK